jgi:glycosyltransferase involved in cell wall biosynthesis
MVYCIVVHMNKPLVSVVLPVFNAEATIESCIRSLLDQTLVDFELLIGDDGSNDGTPAILQTLAESDPRIRLFTYDHRGLVPTINDLVNVVRAPLIARQDSDDISLPDRLQVQAEFLDSHEEVDAVASRVELFTDDGEPGRGHGRFVDWINDILTPEEHRLNMFAEQPLAHPSVMTRRRAYDCVGTFRRDEDQPFPEDYDFWLRFLAGGLRVAKMPEVLYHWRDSGSRLTRTSAAYSIEAFYRVKNRYLAAFIADNHPGKTIYIWGAGRVTRKRFTGILGSGLNIGGFIDISPKLIGNVIGGLPVRDVESVQAMVPGKDLVLICVGGHGVREQVIERLEANGLRIGNDWLLCSH